ncbi:unnamed protein product [Linum trigynum]|uniref:Uncharacterized protein n=1 Tax=Linum trigynum TaxID=586398 RepID=A0AAV2E8F2_9ROSI
MESRWHAMKRREPEPFSLLSLGSTTGTGSDWRKKERSFRVWRNKASISVKKLSCLFVAVFTAVAGFHDRDGIGRDLTCKIPGNGTIEVVGIDIGPSDA